MKKTSKYLLLVVLCAVALSAAAATARVSGNVLKSVETSLDERIKSFWPDNIFSVIRLTRGLYLDGYGAVFTVDVSPVLSNIDDASDCDQGRGRQGAQGAD
jgi:hypothetical protein